MTQKMLESIAEKETEKVKVKEPTFSEKVDAGMITLDKSKSKGKSVKTRGRKQTASKIFPLHLKVIPQDPLP